VAGCTPLGNNDHSHAEMSGSLKSEREQQRRRSQSLAGHYWFYPQLLGIVRVWERYLTTGTSIEGWQVTA